MEANPNGPITIFAFDSQMKQWVRSQASTTSNPISGSHFEICLYGVFESDRVAVNRPYPLIVKRTLGL